MGIHIPGKTVFILFGEYWGINVCHVGNFVTCPICANHVCLKWTYSLYATQHKCLCEVNKTFLAAHRCQTLHLYVDIITFWKFLSWHAWSWCIITLILHLDRRKVRVGLTKTVIRSKEWRLFYFLGKLYKVSILYIGLWCRHMSL